MEVETSRVSCWRLSCWKSKLHVQFGRKLLAIFSVHGFSSEPRLSDSSVDALTRWEIASSRSNVSRAWCDSVMVVGSGSVSLRVVGPRGRLLGAPPRSGQLPHRRANPTCEHPLRIVEWSFGRS